MDDITMTDSEGKDLKVEEDPLVAEYDIFITPENLKQLYLLQHTNRLTEKHTLIPRHSYPRELRSKPGTGFVELDYEIKMDKVYDRFKGANWGQALKDASNTGAKFGLGEGFGKGGRLSDGTVKVANERAESPASEGEDEEEEYASDASDELTGKGELMKFNTVGGQILPPQEGQPYYMLGAFQGGKMALINVAMLTCQILSISLTSVE
jgi:DNA-directed RNA polymerase III subunit RPC5